MLADGGVHLTAVRLLAPHMTVDNHAEVLDSARGKTKLETQEIVARLAPRPDAPASVRRVPLVPSPLVSAPVMLRCRRHNDYEGRLYFGPRRRARVLVPERADLSVTGSTRRPTNSA